MAKSETNPKVDAFIGRAKSWQGEMKALRRILLGFPLAEEIKWGKPCYTYEGKNLFLINSLKESCPLMFFNGVLLKDSRGLLKQPGENSQTTRWIKFASVGEIEEMEPVLKAYIREAIDAEKAGLKAPREKSRKLDLPEELEKKFGEIRGLKAAFEALTPGRQRSWVLHFSAAKQSKTREARIEKGAQEIFAGRGFNER